MTERTVWTILILAMIAMAVSRTFLDPSQSAGREYVKQVDGKWVKADMIDRKAGIAQVSYDRTAGLWIAAVFTLCIFSFMYRDNPFYKVAESTVVGVSAAYYMVVGLWTTLVPNLFAKLMPGLIQQWAMPGLSPELEATGIYYIVPLILGIMLLMRLVPSMSWISLWPLAFIIGTTAGLRMIAYLEADFLSQIENSFIPLIVFTDSGIDYWQSFQNTFMIVSILSCLVYFFFSIEHKGAVAGVSKFGIWILMMTFGAMFGMTVMGRIALLAIRLEFLFREWMNIRPY
ncbi:hypothetical protein [Rubinisphaera italica]|uniref:Uncharacterized protein n=1 Tax=Rubinisphaera italica TaxID=2527969 RepID=A0A5C5XCB5_9PLAN|nr:hypothetical protein [Rubinisphaera italica]TWT60404.1 hypothetical protein Pan54_11180 [Rubinisphaera italica]